MELTPMQYKDFIWPHNPRRYTIRYQRQVAVHKVPFGRYAMQDLGLSHRVMEGEGEFYGPRAYETFRALAAVFYQGGPGQLIHPVWQSARVHFVALSLTQEPRRDHVRYRFAFWEDAAPGEEQSRETAPGEAVTAAASPSEWGLSHTVAQGETLWSIARRWGVSLAEIIQLNPQIKNPNVIRAGQEIRLR